MREAFISDVHGNDYRLEIAFELLKEHGYDRIWCLGDTVMDFPWREKDTEICTEMIKEKCHAWLLGNHDLRAQQRKTFSLQSIVEYLSDALIIAKEKDLVYSHLGPDVPCTPENGDRFGYHIYTPDRAHFEFANANFRLAFLGHTHVPAAFANDGKYHYFTRSETIELGNKNWLLTVGAVERSRDENPSVSCAIYDSDKNTFTVLRNGEIENKNFFNMKRSNLHD